MAQANKKVKFHRFSKVQLIAAALFVIGFGGFGIYKLAFSSAATTTTTIYGFRDYRDAIVDPNLGITVVKDSINMVGGVGAEENVLELAPRAKGSKLNFGGRGADIGNVPPIDSSKFCYVLRAVDNPAVVRIANGNNSRSVQLKAAPGSNYGSNNYWQYECIEAVFRGAEGQVPLDYQVKWVSGGAVRVYRVDTISKYYY